VAAIVIPLAITAVLFAGSLLANGLRVLSLSRQIHHDGLRFAIKNSALYYAVTRERLPSLRNYVLVRFGSILRNQGSMGSSELTRSTVYLSGPPH
jgi:hypothetical protein